MIGAVDEAVDLAHDERGFVVLVVALVADDQLAVALLGPEVLRPVRALLAITAFAASRMRCVDR